MVVGPAYKRDRRRSHLAGHMSSVSTNQDSLAYECLEQIQGHPNKTCKTHICHVDYTSTCAHTPTHTATESERPRLTAGVTFRRGE
jgi:hypothetical protein